LPEIWDFGMRNPWKFTFDDPNLGGTGALIIADVGQDVWEEIDYEPYHAGGRNYGWSIREGLHPVRPTRTTPFGEGVVDPIWEYVHSMGNISITGGYVYRGTALGPSYNGRYFYADYGSGRVWSIGLAVDPNTGDASVVDQIDHTAELGTLNQQIS